LAYNDLHPTNVVAKDGVPCAAIEFGDMGPGDPAIDLATVRTLLPPVATSAFFAHNADADPATTCRARDFAVREGAFVTQAAINGLRGIPSGKPGRLAAGRKGLDRVLAVC
jgi:aminoglycoside phosphotransferase (APT) family kinase protein